MKIISLKVLRRTSLRHVFHSLSRIIKNQSLPLWWNMGFACYLSRLLSQNKIRMFSNQDQCTWHTMPSSTKWVNHGHKGRHWESTGIEGLGDLLKAGKVLEGGEILQGSTPIISVTQYLKVLAHIEICSFTENMFFCGADYLVPGTVAPCILGENRGMSQSSGFLSANAWCWWGQKQPWQKNEISIDNSWGSLLRREHS